MSSLGAVFPPYSPLFKVKSAVDRIPCMLYFCSTWTGWRLLLNSEFVLSLLLPRPATRLSFSCKSWSKYATSLISFVRSRLAMELEYAKAMQKLSEQTRSALAADSGNVSAEYRWSNMSKVLIFRESCPLSTYLFNS